MGYKGTTLNIPAIGGWNATYNVENIPPGSLTISKNINLHNGGYEPRGGTSKFNSSVITDNPRVMGAYHYNVGSTSKIIAYTAVGGTVKDKIYEVGAAGVVGSVLETVTNGITKYPSFASYNYVTYICNGYDTIQTFNGTTCSDLSAPHADWGANDQPIQLIKHGAGNSERLWAVGTTGTPGFIYYSQDNDGVLEASFTASGSGRIFIDTGDKYGLTGAIEYQDRLMVFGKNTTYILDDSSGDVNDWGYVQAGWFGGCATFRLAVATPNDVFCMTDDGEIYSVTAAQSYGDYKSASITKPAGIDVWIKDNVDMTYVKDFHAIYDYQMKAIKWFVVRTANTSHQVDTCLVFYTDREPSIAWTLHDNLSANINGYNASCSFYVKDTDNKIKVYTGDWGGTLKGTLWNTEQSSYADNSTAYEVKLKTPRISVGGENGISDPRRTKRFQALRVIDQNFLNATYFGIKIYIDGTFHNNLSYGYSRGASGFILGTSILGTGTLSSDKSEFIEYIAEIGNFGRKIEVEIGNNSQNNVYFFISAMMLDYRPITVGV